MRICYTVCDTLEEAARVLAQLTRSWTTYKEQVLVVDGPVPALGFTKDKRCRLYCADGTLKIVNKDWAVARMVCGVVCWYS